MSNGERKVNDIGGLPAGAIDRSEHAVTLFEQRVDALLMLLTNRKVGIFEVDALRRAIEENSAGDYERLGYYDKWIRAISRLLVEQEVLEATEIEAKVEKIRARRGAITDV